MWTNVARNRIEETRRPRDILPDLDVDGLDDLFYVPPVAEGLRGVRDDFLRRLAGDRVPVLAQLLPGETCDVEGVRVVVDLLPVLLLGDVDRLHVVEGRRTVVWPLIPGCTDRLDLQEEGCAVLASLGVRTLLVVAPEVSAALRRRWAEQGDAFDELFHGGPASERELVRCAARHGLAAFPERDPVGSPRTVRNRRIGAVLALIGELSSRMGDPTSLAQTFLRAARGAETTRRDLVALVREGNLGLLEWVDSRTEEVVSTVSEGEVPDLLASLFERYSGAGSGGSEGRSSSPQTPE